MEKKKDKNTNQLLVIALKIKSNKIKFKILNQK